MDFNSPKSEPNKTFKKVETEKVEKTEIASKPDQKPSDKPKNKIERSKLIQKTPSRNKIQHEKINLLTPSKNKIFRPKLDLKIPSRNKIFRPTLDLETPSKNKIFRPTLDLETPSRNKMQYTKFDIKAPPRHKIDSCQLNSEKGRKHKIKHQNFDSNKPDKAKIQVKPSHKINVKEIDGNLVIKSFPKKSRIIICEEIYKNFNEKRKLSDSRIVDTLIKDLRDKKSLSKWISELPVDELKELRNNLVNTKINSRFEDSLLNYFKDITNLVKDIKNFNEENQDINFSELSRNLIRENRGLNLTKRGLEEVISGVYSNFKNSFYDFKLDRAKRKPIIGTESEKESIRCLRKEYKLLIEMNDGIYKGQCSNPNCKIDFKRLPAFDFHHEDSKSKNALWSEIMHKNYTEIKNSLESQKVKPICKNCHLPENAKIFNDFKNIIMKKDLFTYSSQDIDKFLNLKVNKFVEEYDTNYTAASLKFEVKRWIKKRSVIEQVFNGKCISCEEDRLPSLQTHHTDQDLKVHRWGDISRKWNIKELINEYIIEEECVCLCGNCHAMITTKNFENNVEEVLGVKYVQEIKADYNKIKVAIMKNTNRIKKIKKGLAKLSVKDHLNDE